MKLIDKYLPSDYYDSVSKRIKPTEPLSPDNIFEESFNSIVPCWYVCLDGEEIIAGMGVIEND